MFQLVHKLEVSKEARYKDFRGWFLRADASIERRKLTHFLKPRRTTAWNNCYFNARYYNIVVKVSFLFVSDFGIQVAEKSSGEQLCNLKFQDRWTDTFHESWDKLFKVLKTSDKVEQSFALAINMKTFCISGPESCETNWWR